MFVGCNCSLYGFHLSRRHLFVAVLCCIRNPIAQVGSTIVPLRAELNRTKDQCNKERTGRIGAQQQIAAMKDQIAMLENANENLDREVKTIPALTESNEILKNDLAQLRRRYKEEKAQMAKHIKGLEGQSRDVEAIRGCVRELSMKLLDLANTGTVPSSLLGVGSVSSSMNMAGAGAVGGMNSGIFHFTHTMCTMVPH